MARKTVLYFEDDDGEGRVARDEKRRGHWDDDGYHSEKVHDYLVIERYEDGNWVETKELGSYVDPSDLDAEKP